MGLSDSDICPMMVTWHWHLSHAECPNTCHVPMLSPARPFPGNGAPHCSTYCDFLTSALVCINSTQLGLWLFTRVSLHLGRMDIFFPQEKAFTWAFAPKRENLFISSECQISSMTKGQSHHISSHLSLSLTAQYLRSFPFQGGTLSSASNVQCWLSCVKQSTASPGSKWSTSPGEPFQQISNVDCSNHSVS